MQDPKDKSQSISVTAFQSVPADEERTGVFASPMGSRNLSMDADIAQAIQLSLAGRLSIAPASSLAPSHPRFCPMKHLLQMCKHTVLACRSAEPQYPPCFLIVSSLSFQPCYVYTFLAPSTRMTVVQPCRRQLTFHCMQPHNIVSLHIHHSPVVIASVGQHISWSAA